MATSIPRLSLAPKLTRPLSLLKPLDYLRLLYWVFFFPQALRWYVDKFASLDIQNVRFSSERNWRESLQAFWNFSIQRRLTFQGLLLTILVPAAICWGLQLVGVKISWLGVLIGIVIGIALSIPLSTQLSVLMSMEFGTKVGIAFGIAAGMALGITDEAALSVSFIPFVIAIGAAVGAAFGITFAIIFGIPFSVTGGIARGIPSGIVGGVTTGIALGVAAGTAGGIIVGMTEGVITGVKVGVSIGFAVGLVFSAALLFSLMHISDYLFFELPHSLFKLPYSFITHTTWLPRPGLQAALTAWLCEDNCLGLSNANELFAYTRQFIPATRAINDWLAKTPNDQLLRAVDMLATSPFDWKLLYYCSASLSAKMKQEGVEGIVFIPALWRKHLQAHFNADLRLDSPAQVACAAYWLLHERDTSQACEAFKQVRNLPHGEILYRSVLALHKARQVVNLEHIVQWGEQTNWLDQQENSLRPKSITSMQRLHKIALEATVASESISKLNRSAVLGRAVAGLTQLLVDGVETCPALEWPIIEQIAIQWREILSLAAGEVWQIAIERPVLNPFVVGSPVKGQIFVGRDETFETLETLWGSNLAQCVPSVVLFGHRRMGKSSILQNLGKHRFGVDTLVAQCTMQRVGKLAHTGELLNYLALAMYDTLAENGHDSLPEPRLEDFNQGWYPAFNRFLRVAKQAIGNRRMILTLDEFELVEREIAAGRIEPELLEYLRGIIHSEPWLILALAGLHTLEEMTADYWNPLFASVTPVRISFLSPGASAQLLANPSDDFALDFTRETADHVYALVKGQPYLTQLVGHTLVRRYNRLVFEEGKPRDRRFTPEDVDAVINSPEFYEQGSYYFNGVWEQAEKSGPTGQSAILRALAGQDGPQSAASIFANAKLPEIECQNSLKTLLQHDVVQRLETGEVDFAVPLMRRWIREHKG